MTKAPGLILASASKSRAQLLKNAQIPFDQVPSYLDEDILKKDGLAHNWSVEQTALALAEAKALDVSKLNPDVYVLGADQMLDCAGRRFDKPTSLAEAKRQLSSLQGHIHYLISACVIYKNGQKIWDHTQRAELEMRPLSPRQLETYLSKIGDEAKETVGCYRLESLGVHLFKRIEGDYFTILGLPLLAVLDALRDLDIIE